MNIKQRGELKNVTGNNIQKTRDVKNRFESQEIHLVYTLVFPHPLNIVLGKQR